VGGHPLNAPPGEREREARGWKVQGMRRDSAQKTREKEEGDQTIDFDWVRIKQKERTQKNDAVTQSILDRRVARHKNEGEGTKTIWKRWLVGAVAK
jgi:hypothetical protein